MNIGGITLNVYTEVTGVIICTCRYTFTAQRKRTECQFNACLYATQFGN